MTTPTNSRRDALKYLGLGAITSAIAPSALLQACREAAEAGPATAYQVLSAAQAATLGAIQDAILPRTDTPSATDVGSVQFVDTWLRHGYEDADRDRVLYQLDRFAARLKDEHGVEDATAVTPEQMGAMMTSYFVDYEAPEEEASTNTVEIEGHELEVEDEGDGTVAAETTEELGTHTQVEEAVLTYGEDPEELNKLLTDLRWMTFESYFQSKQVGTEVLNYDPIPGAYIGKYPMSQVPNGRAWSL